MLENYFKVALRNLRSSKGFAFINVAGLAIGLACFTLILLFVRDELSYDRHHERADNIYRISVQINSQQGEQDLAQTPPFWIPGLVDEIPEVKNAVRFKPPRQKWMVSYENVNFSEIRWVFADSTVFDIFDIDLVQGVSERALTDPFTVVINESMARKYFGRRDPVDRILSLDNQYDFRVTAVMKDAPTTSHFQYDFLASFISMQDPQQLYLTDVPAVTFPFAYTYLLLDENVDLSQVDNKIDTFVNNAIPANQRAGGITIDADLIPLTDIHLKSHRSDEIVANASMGTVLVFIAIAIFILLIASVNFMNLATARSSGRAREVAVRKVVGASRSHLVRQFLGESVLISLLALFVGLLLAIISLPVFNSLTGKEFGLLHLFDPGTIAIVIGVTLVTGLVSGSYPAFFLSAFEPATVLKGTFNLSGRNGIKLRDALVVFQFAISIALIIATAVVYNQMKFINGKSLGFDKDQVLVVELTDPTPTRLYPVFRDAIVRHPNVLSVTAANGTPGGFTQEIRIRPGHITTDENWVAAWYATDFLYTETLGIEMAAGRPLTSDFSSDSTRAVVINETAAAAFGWTNPEEAIGQEVEFLGFGNARLQIVGVTKDFHTKSVHEVIGPVVMSHFANFHFFAFVRLQMDDLQQTIASLEESWTNILPGYLFDYSFLDDDFDQLYRSDVVLQQLLKYFALLTIFIACMGLFGLASFAAERRSKEIGIRKAMGASVPGIAYLLTRDLVRLVIPAFIIATPLAYFAMRSWLNDFAYSTEMSIATFAAVFTASLVIATATVGIQAARAALENPIKALRNE
ncbi:MAG: ABC transporter permease [Bacteroidetes bacterium]|nr:ABC transporter permease [Bacteroidota bacterium]MCH8246003.1 ABC transporter permease [Bacteroidota bacterium]